jgi:hypothetical protein
MILEWKWEASGAIMRGGGITVEFEGFEHGQPAMIN